MLTSDARQRYADRLDRIDYVLMELMGDLHVDKEHDARALVEDAADQLRRARLRVTEQVAP